VVGVILDLQRNQEIVYAWGIGIATNNEVEALTLFKGILFLKFQGVKETSIVGDSMIVL